jgi:hypothetical protein
MPKVSLDVNGCKGYMVLPVTEEGRAGGEGLHASSDPWAEILTLLGKSPTPSGLCMDAHPPMATNRVPLWPGVETGSF